MNYLTCFCADSVHFLNPAFLFRLIINRFRRQHAVFHNPTGWVITIALQLIFPTSTFIDLIYATEEGHPDLAGAYGHIPPSFLYADLIDATTEAGLVNSLVYLFCCDDWENQVSGPLY